MTPLSDDQASPEARAVFDDMRHTRKQNWVNNFWRVLAHDPPTLTRIWGAIKQVMVRPSTIDPLTKEMIYIAVSVANKCGYCVASHRAAAIAKGMTAAQWHELMAIIALAHQTNALASGYAVEIDPRFQETGFDNT